MKTPPNILAKNRRYKARNHERLSLYYRQRNGRCTPEQFTGAIAKQHNRCGICEREFSETLRPCADHNHDTKEFRGLLCHSCNLGLGKFEDSLKLITAAAKWLGESNVSTRTRVSLCEPQEN